MTRSKNPNPRQLTEEDEKKGSRGDATTSGDNETNNADSSSVKSSDDDAELRIDIGVESPRSDGRHSPDQENISAKRDALAKLTARKFASVYQANDESETEPTFATHSESEETDGQLMEKYRVEIETPEARASLNFSPSSPPSFFVMGSKSRAASMNRPPPPLRKMVQSCEESSMSCSPASRNKASRQKTSSPSGMLNPEIMNWMSNRFEMKPGGKISASDIIRIYNEDMKELPNPPPTLQNYQVGQLLRRVFPTIQRCKITVNSKRVWVYRHLTLIDHDNPSSFCTQFNDDSRSPDVGIKENGISADEVELEENCRISDSPLSNVGFDDSELVEEDNRSPNSIGNEVDVKDVAKKDKNHEILIGLLGQKSEIKVEPSSPDNFHGLEASSTKEENASEYLPQNGVDSNTTLPMKKKRDSEVVDWLLENYKFKAGYFVKSMDLLRRYNDGREELVKYLSQVGRVMKHVFPGVRHLRKSFRGGKREWVYLNLKPIEVDSDSEEGKTMQMFNIRRPPRPSKFEPKLIMSKRQEESPDWKRERVNITHMPLSLVQNRNAIFKPRASMYHSVSRIDGNKLIISRNPASAVSSKNESASQLEDSDRQDLHFGNVPQLKTIDDSSPNRTRIILYNKQRDQEKGPHQISDDCRIPSDLERDIFAPFTRISGQSNDTTQPPALKRQGILSSRLGVQENQKSGLQAASSESAEGVFVGTQQPLEESAMSLNTSEASSDSRWASKRLRLCATETVKSVVDAMTENESNSAILPDSSSGVSVGLDLSVKQEKNFHARTGVAPLNKGDFNDPPPEEVLNLTKNEHALKEESGLVISKIQSLSSKSQTIHYRPTEEVPALLKMTSPLAELSQSNSAIKSTNASESIGHESTLLSSSSFNCTPTTQSRRSAPGSFRHVDWERNSLKRTHADMNHKQSETSISWASLQNFNAQKYGWLRSPHTSWTAKNSETGGKKVLKFVEWFLFSGQWLMNKQRALREIKIYDDWTVVIHALGCRVYPNDLGGITDLEKTAESLNKVFRVLAEAKLCMGFPAPSISDLYIHGILVSKFEVWSSREDSGEDIRQRAVNCQILYSGPGACCNKCMRIMRLHQQQKRGAGLMKRLGQTDTAQQRPMQKHQAS